MNLHAHREPGFDEARNFIENETAFHLGDLITEKSHPKSRELSKWVQSDSRLGIACLQEVDRDIAPVAKGVLEDPSFELLIKGIVQTILGGGRVVFSSCGASGRLAIILEAMWREYWEGNPIENQVLSIMTGGDRALIRSVENFEDYQNFGKRQVEDAQLNASDLLLALTEGGEISSVIGTMKEAVQRGTPVFMFFNNPRDLLIRKFQRSKEVLTHPGIISLELTTGPMALTGSTRMQATTIGMLLAGIALDLSFQRLEGKQEKEKEWYLEQFESLLDQLSSGSALDGIIALTDREFETYRQNGRITYLAEKYLLDVFSDTTERTPTFMIPPFRAFDDPNAPVPWTFAKDPFRDSASAWNYMLKRNPRGLNWNADDYRMMGAPDAVVKNPPKLSMVDILKYQIGNESDSSRWRNSEDVLIPIHFNAGNLVRVPNQWEIPANCSHPLFIGELPKSVKGMQIPLVLQKTRVQLFEHLAMKLIFNTMSTAVMAKLGRVQGNWMIQVDATNKKLIDRATRIIQHFTGLSYEQSCHELHKTIKSPEIDRLNFHTSYVQQTLNRLQKTAP